MSAHAVRWRKARAFLAFSVLSTQLGCVGISIIQPELAEVAKSETASVPDDPQEPAPTHAVEAVVPSLGSIGIAGKVVIRGWGFEANPVVTIGGQACASPQVLSSKEILCEAPAFSASGAQDVVVSYAGAQTQSLAGGYEILARVASACATAAPTLYVDDDWGPLANGTAVTWTDGSAHVIGTDAFGSIAAAHTVAAVGDRIQVAAGTYTTAATITKTVAICGAQQGVDARLRPGTPALESVLTRAAGGQLVLNADNVTVDGFDFTGATGGVEYAISMNLARSGFHLYNNRCHDNVVCSRGGSSGVNRSIWRYNYFKNNNLPGALSGYAFRSTTTINNYLFEENWFEQHNNSGIIAAGASPDTVVRANVFEGSALQFLLTSDRLAVRDNRFHRAVYTQVAAAGATIEVSSNLFRDQEYGAVVAGSSAATTGLQLVDNVFLQDVSVYPVDRGIIYLQNTGGASKVSGNAIRFSGTFTGAVASTWGIQLDGGGIGTIEISGNRLHGGDVTSTDGVSGIRLHNTVPATASIDIRDNVFEHFKYGIYAGDLVGAGLSAGVTVSCSDNSFVDNSSYGILNAGTTPQAIVANDNWWGHASGPTHASNASGQGDAISDDVTATSWLTEAP